MTALIFSACHAVFKLKARQILLEKTVFYPFLHLSLGQTRSSRNCKYPNNFSLSSTWCWSLRNMMVKTYTECAFKNTSYWFFMNHPPQSHSFLSPLMSTLHPGNLPTAEETCCGRCSVSQYAPQDIILSTLSCLQMCIAMHH